jgi:predicted DNA-binding protein (MmcQ/YjbR family)
MSMPMSREAVLAYCEARPGAAEEHPFGPETAVFKVGGKIFAICDIVGDPPSVSLKCDPDLAVHLRATYAAVRPGYHLNKRHWNTVVLDSSIPDDELVEMLEDSYRLVVAGLPKRERERLSCPSE